MESGFFSTESITKNSNKLLMLDDTVVVINNLDMWFWAGTWTRRGQGRRASSQI